VGGGGACVPRDPSRSSGGSGTGSAVTHWPGPCADPARSRLGAAAAPGPGSSLLGGQARALLLLVLPGPGGLPPAVGQVRGAASGPPARGAAFCPQARGAAFGPPAQPWWSSSCSWPSPGSGLWLLSPGCCLQPPLPRTPQVARKEADCQPPPFPTPPDGIFNHGQTMYVSQVCARHHGSQPSASHWVATP
jgi:hypothetical protein